MFKYVPARDYRFEYLTEVMAFVEERQCYDCAFKSDREDYPMCFEVEAQIFSENGPVQALDDLGSDGVECVLHRDELLAEREHPDQLKLF